MVLGLPVLAGRVARHPKKPWSLRHDRGPIPSRHWGSPDFVAPLPTASVGLPFVGRLFAPRAGFIGPGVATMCLEGSSWSFASWACLKSSASGGVSPIDSPSPQLADSRERPCFPANTPQPPSVISTRGHGSFFVAWETVAPVVVGVSSGSPSPAPPPQPARTKSASPWTANPRPTRRSCPCAQPGSRGLF